NEYKTEAFSLFEKLLIDLRTNVTRWLMTVEFQYQDPEPEPEPLRFQEIHRDPLTGENERAKAFAGAGIGLNSDERAALPISALPHGWERTARNADCPCGSGRKFKHCHGRLI
ncbi:MAG: SEC-C metal-binding domain-containing protein, partial [Reyranella sp.]|nr:SEC-C metal-binding domain-containing protein [Reyranella sp.]